MDTSDSEEASSSDADTQCHGKTEDMWITQVAGLKEELTGIMEDLTDRVMEGDHNVFSGVAKFIKAYQMMVKSHAPNSSISYALHNFGKPDSKWVFQ